MVIRAGSVFGQACCLRRPVRQASSIAPAKRVPATACIPTIIRVTAGIAARGGRQGPETARSPALHEADRPQQPDYEQSASEEESYLQAQERLRAPQPPRLRHDAREHAEPFGQHRELQQLHTQHHRAGHVQHRVDPQVVRSVRPGILQHGKAHKTRGEQERAGVQEQPAGAEQQQELQVTPAISPRAQMGRTITAVGPQLRRDLCDRQAGERRFRHHFAGELHSAAHQAQCRDRLPMKAANAAVEVADGGAKEEAPDETEHRVSEIPVQQRHRSALDAAAESISHHQPGSAS
jgi:hypothetical protein